jgi:hypothetical protein
VGGECSMDYPRWKRNAYSVLMGKPVRKKHLENREVDRIILKCILHRMTWCGVACFK